MYWTQNRPQCGSALRCFPNIPGKFVLQRRFALKNKIEAVVVDIMHTDLMSHDSKVLRAPFTISSLDTMLVRRTQPLHQMLLRRHGSLTSHATTIPMLILFLNPSAISL